MRVVSVLRLALGARLAASRALPVSSTTLTPLRPTHDSFDGGNSLGGGCCGRLGLDAGDGGQLSADGGFRHSGGDGWECDGCAGGSRHRWSGSNREPDVGKVDVDAVGCGSHPGDTVPSVCAVCG